MWFFLLKAQSSSDDDDGMKMDCEVATSFEIYWRFEDKWSAQAVVFQPTCNDSINPTAWSKINRCHDYQRSKMSQ